MNDVSATLARPLMEPEKYGFHFVYEDVNTDKGETNLGKAPVLVITDVVKFEQNFPGRITAMLDGSSARVISQRVTRDALTKTRIPEADRKSLEPKVFNAIMGVKSRAPIVVEKKVFGLPDGSTTTDEAAFRAAWGLPAA